MWVVQPASTSQAKRTSQASPNITEQVNPESSKNLQHPSTSPFVPLTQLKDSNGYIKELLWQMNLKYTKAAGFSWCCLETRPMGHGVE